MQTSRASAIPAREPDATALTDKRADIWISYFVPDFAFARRIAEVVHNLGYTVAPYELLNYAHLPREKLTPNDARCVIALWTPHALKEKQIQADARTAGNRHALIEIGFRGACPDQRFSEAALINFPRFDNAPHGAQWRELLARVRVVCGPPPKRTSELLSMAPAAIATLATIAGVGAGAMMIGNMVHERREAAARPFTPPATQEIPNEVLAAAKRPSLTPTSDLGVDLGGPDEYIAPDLGTAPPVPVMPLTLEAARPAPTDRSVQGPEE
ncbi:MAG: hypothetical protein FD124_781 [Alphaproteobacteria bacterium]|nr:MAG: hypothetical protein FD160_3412 [Caulobacteraceae bacterium]TPW07940.1 MAG: hypothetical protein FD124_781 [Alphaproteobacteria bacterium]